MTEGSDLEAMVPVNDYQAQVAKEIALCFENTEAQIATVSYQLPHTNPQKLLTPMRKKKPMIPCGDVVITPDQMDALTEVVERCGPVCEGPALPRVIRFFTFFGVDEPVCDYLHDCIVHYTKGTQSNEFIKHAITCVRSRYPHAYNLMQLASEMIQRLQERMYMMDLPLTTTIAQIQAIQSSYCLPLDSFVIPHTAGVLMMCPTCRQLNSQVQDSGSVYKKVYRYGQHHHCSNIIGETVQIFCDRKNTDCKSERVPLIRLPLIGSVLHIGGDLYMLCTQSRCRSVMVLEREEMKAVYTMKGPACHWCAQRVNRDHIVAMIHANYCGGRPICCLICGTECGMDAFAYTNDVFLCKKHHNTWIQQYVIKASGEHDEEEQTAELVTQAVEMYQCI